MALVLTLMYITVETRSLRQVAIHTHPVENVYIVENTNGINMFIVPNVMQTNIPKNFKIKTIKHLYEL